MNMKQIEGFCYLAQTLNFSKAAEMLYISQPAFSRMIVSLEEELGCQLFVRSKAAPKLTLAGEKIYKSMESMRREYENICTIAKFAEQNKLGHLRIGILANGLTEKARNTINQFMNEHKEFTLELKEYSEVEIFRVLEMDWIDTAFLIHFPETFRESMEGIMLETSRECVVLHKDHPLAGRATLAVADLKDVPFIMLHKNKSEMGYNQVMTECLSNGFSPNVAMMADSVGSALFGVECNMGCTIITDALKHLTSDNVVFVPISDKKHFSQ